MEHCTEWIFVIVFVGNEQQRLMSDDGICLNRSLTLLFDLDCLCGCLIFECVSDLGHEYWRAATRHCCAHKLIDFAKRTSTICLHNHIALLTQSDVD